MLIKSFAPLRPPPENAMDVSCPPYDVVSREEAESIIGGSQKSFMRVIRPEAVDRQIIDSHSDEAYHVAADNLKDMQARGFLVRDTQPCLYVYSQRIGGHKQTGVVACCHVDDYNNKIIKKHERTRADKEKDRTRMIEALDANSGPVFLTYRNKAQIDALVLKAQGKEPEYDFTTSDGVKHTIWRLPDTEPLRKAFEQVPVAYIADGHHRAAAAAGFAASRGISGDVNSESEWFMAVLFPAGDLKILPYNRCVVDLGEVSRKSFISELKKSFSVEGGATADHEPESDLKMYLAGEWYALRMRNRNRIENSDVPESLDANILQDSILAPLLGITDPRTDDRLVFIGGTDSINKMVEMVDSGMAAAFSLHPVRIGQLLDVSDAGKIMPPKSTWFEPKLRSGLFVHTFH